MGAAVDIPGATLGAGPQRMEPLPGGRRRLIMEEGVESARAADVSDDRVWLQSLVRLAGLLVRDHHEAEDIAAEAAARTLDASRRSPVTNRDAYATRVVINLVNSRGRRRKVERRYLEAQVAPRLEDDGADALGDNELLLAQLYRLPVKQRTALVLRFYLDLSEREAAELMGVAVGTVKSSCSRGLQALRHERKEAFDG